MKIINNFEKGFCSASICFHHLKKLVAQTVETFYNKIAGDIEDDAYWKQNWAYWK